MHGDFPWFDKHSNSTLSLLLAPLRCRKQEEANLESSSSSSQALDGAGDLLHTHIAPLPALEKGSGCLQVCMVNFRNFF